jgi:hypothetical protein
VPELPVKLDAVLARAMAKDPAERYPSAGDLARDARAATDGQRATLLEHTVATGRAAPASSGRDAPAPAPAGPRGPAPAPTARLPLAARRRGLIAAALAAVVVVVLAVGGVFGSSSHHAKPITTRVQSTPTPPPAPTTKTYSNSALGVSFKYPASWHPFSLQGSPADFGTGSGKSETRCALEIERGQGPASSSQEARFAFVRERSAIAANVARQYELRGSRPSRR